MKKLVMTLGVAILVAACKPSNRPSDGEAEEAIRKAVDGRPVAKFLVSHECGFGDGRLNRLDKIEIQEWGEPNTAGPVHFVSAKVLLTGRCDSQVPNCGDHKMQLCPAKATDFSMKDPMTIRFTKADFGWSAQPMERDRI